MESPAAGEIEQEVAAVVTADGCGDGTEPAAGECSDFDERVSSARLEYSEACLEVQRIEQEIASLRGRLKEAKEVADAYGVCLQDILASREKPAAKEESPPPPPKAGAPDSEQVYGHSMRKVLTGAGIRGLGKAKIDAICQATPTVGEFEKLRATCPDGRLLAEYMPKGVGQAICDEISDRVIAWIAEAMSGEVPLGRIRRPEPEPEPILPESPEDRLKSLVREQREAIEKYPHPWFDSAPFTNIYQEGLSDHASGRRLEDCPWTPGLQQVSWLLGFSHGEILAEQEEVEEDAASESQDEGDAAELASDEEPIDDTDLLSGDLDSEPEPEPESDGEPEGERGASVVAVRFTFPGDDPPPAAKPGGYTLPDDSDLI